MTDFESQLREAMHAAVADAEPPRSMMQLVRRRHRRRNTWSAVAGALALPVAMAAVLAVGALWGGPRPSQPATAHGAVFPGGGRILVATGAGLAWLYPDGRITQFASGFAGATPAAGELLAWKQTRYGFGYYTMNLDGSDRRLVLPAGHSKQFGNEGAQLSPDGSRLAYWVQDIHPGGAVVTREIWSLDLRTGRKTDLGPGSGPVWKDNATILADSADQRSLLLLNVSDGSRTTYLTVSDPLLVRAYAHARPGAGPPAGMSVDGWGTGAGRSALAVSLSGRNAAAFDIKPAEFLLKNDRILGFAPALPKQGTALMLTWGPHGIFLLQSGAGDNPASWINGTYTGTAQSEQLSRVHVQAGLDPGWDGGAVNPAGNVLALSAADGTNTVTLVPVPSPACHQAGTCLHFAPEQLPEQITLLAWVP